LAAGASPPDPTGRVPSAPQTPYLGFRGPTSKALFLRGGRRGKGRAPKLSVIPDARNPRAATAPKITVCTPILEWFPVVRSLVEAGEAVKMKN